MSPYISGYISATSYWWPSSAWANPWALLLFPAEHACWHAGYTDGIDDAKAKPARPQLEPEVVR